MALWKKWCVAIAIVAISPLAFAGPDVIVGDLHEVASWGIDDDIAAYSVGTVSCNIGDEILLWIAGTAEHPVIGQNMYRFKDGRFEHVGRSWLKHGFTALQMEECSPCAANPDGTALGVGCSDPYSAGLNGAQTDLWSRSEVNAATGEFTYPPDLDPPVAAIIGRRLQVSVDDIDPAMNADALYVVEGQYVTLDDAADGNGANNASWREITVDDDADFSISLIGETEREDPAIYAWQEFDADVTIMINDLAGDGRMLLGYKVTALGLGGSAGPWSYEYALYNLNSDRGARSFSVPVPDGVVLTDIGFHAAPYHSGDPYSNDQWTSEVDGGTITWSTDTFAADETANALRWGSMMNFRFTADSEPEGATASAGIFKPGTPSTRTFSVLAPSSPVTASEFTAIPTTGAAPLIVEFVSLAVGGVTSWEWDFGDGATSTETNPVHIYSAEGTYTVSLTVEGLTGVAVETKVDYIDAGPAVNFLRIDDDTAYAGSSDFEAPIIGTNGQIVSAFTASIAFDDAIFDGAEVSFENTVLEGGEFLSFEIGSDFITINAVLDPPPLDTGLIVLPGFDQDFATLVFEVTGTFDDGETTEVAFVDGLGSGVDTRFIAFGSSYPAVTTNATITLQNQAEFIRGDCDGNGQVALLDPLILLGYLFAGAAAPDCLSACDFDDNNLYQLLDALKSLTYQFASGSPPAPPFPAAGTDPTPDPEPCS